MCVTHKLDVFRLPWSHRAFTLRLLRIVGLAVTAAGCALMFVLSASAFQLVRTRASAQRKAFVQYVPLTSRVHPLFSHTSPENRHTPSNNRRNTFARQDASRRRASGLGKLGLFNQNMGQSNVDAPLQATLEELKSIASGNAKMTAAIQRLTEVSPLRVACTHSTSWCNDLLVLQLVTRDRGWDPIARDAFIVQRTVSDDSQSTNAQLGVDAETAEWLVRFHVMYAFAFIPRASASSVGCVSRDLCSGCRVNQSTSCPAAGANGCPRPAAEKGGWHQ